MFKVQQHQQPIHTRQSIQLYLMIAFIAMMISVTCLFYAKHLNPATSLSHTLVFTASQLSNAMSQHYNSVSLAASSLSFSSSSSSSSSSQTSSSPSSRTNHGKPKGVILYLGGLRDSYIYNTCQRFEMLAGSLKSVEDNFNRAYQYDIILFYEDYLAEDLAFLQAQVKSVKIIFEKINLVDLALLHFNLTREQIKTFTRPNIGYACMCWFWSGYVQNHPLVAPYDMYMRMDDDSFILTDLTPTSNNSASVMDMFEVFERQRLTYVYRAYVPVQTGGLKTNFLDYTRQYFKKHPHLNMTCGSLAWKWHNPASMNHPLFREGPYNNWHISRLSMWRDPIVREYIRGAEKEYLWLELGPGDIEWHVMVTTMMVHEDCNAIKMWANEFDYRHNFHEFPPGRVDAYSAFRETVGWLHALPRCTPPAGK